MVIAIVQCVAKNQRTRSGDRMTVKGILRTTFAHVDFSMDWMTEENHLMKKAGKGTGKGGWLMK
jgi:hypothetical protein